MNLRRRLAHRRTLQWGLAAAFVLLFVFALVRRHERPPTTSDDVCAVLADKPGWYRSVLRAERRWGVPAPVQLAILFQESSFRARARPPRRWLWGIIPGPRPSTAYGYAQVLDGTWRSYQDAVDHRARRNHFPAVADFVSWYGDEIHRQTGITKTDARNLYLAYHEGPSGYQRGSHRSKEWLLGVALRVQARSARYGHQLDACGTQLLRRSRARRLVGLTVACAALGLAFFLGRSTSRPRPSPRRTRRRVRRKASRRQR